MRFIPTGPVNPARKRDIGVKEATGEIIAFIDDDAYPAKDWLRSALVNFTDEEIAAVGGPAVTPPEDSVRQKISGLIYSSFLVSGPYAYRYRARKTIFSDDLPSCNFLVRKSIMKELGGFNTDFWPGEDTKLCLDISKKLGKKIVYDPAVLVYHHRRRIFLPHLKQISNYAFCRGIFVKKFPETSLRLAYFIPSFFLLFIVFGGFLCLFWADFRAFYASIISIYIFCVFGFSLNKKLLFIPLVFSGIIFTHLTYGAFFLKGLLTRVSSS